MERRFIDSLLSGSCDSEVDRSGRARMTFLQKVYTCHLLIISCGLMHLMGYRKGNDPFYSFVAAGLTWLIFWAITRFSSRSSFDFTALSLSKYLLPVPLSLAIEYLGLNFAIYLENGQLSVVILCASSLLRFAYLMLAFAQLTQRLFGGRKHAHTLNHIDTAKGSLLFLLCLLFLFIHIQLHLWKCLASSQSPTAILKCTRKVMNQLLAIR